MSFTSEDVALMLQIARDVSLGNNVTERLAGITDPLSALVPNTSLSAIVLQRDLDAPAAHPHAFFRNGDPNNVREYAQHYIQHDPHPTYLAKVPGRFVPHSHLVPSNRWGCDPFTGDFLTRHRLRYILGGELPLPDGRYLSFAIHREAALRDFTSRECEVLRLLSEDLSRAVYGAILREKIAEIVQDEMGSHLGFLVLDHSGEVIRSDTTGQALLEGLEADRNGSSQVIVANAQRLSAGKPQEGDSVERVLPLLDGRHLQVRLTALSSGLHASILCLLQLHEPAGPDRFEQVADEAKLTPREREVASLAIEGLGNRHIAHKLGCAAVTVGVHLTNIYRKAKVTGRIELTRLMSVDDSSS